MTHPLDPITADEITAAVAAVRATGRLTDAARFSTITIDDARRAGTPEGRRARVVVVPGPEADVVVATVDLAAANQIQFLLGDRTGTVWIADFTLTSGGQ